MNKEALDALDRLLNDALASRDGYGDSRKDAETIRKALLNGADEVTVEDFNFEWFNSMRPVGDYVAKKYPNGLKIIKDTKGD